MGAQRQTRVNEVATLRELHFRSFCRCEVGAEIGISADLVMVFHMVALGGKGISAGLAMVDLHRVAI